MMHSTANQGKKVFLYFVLFFGFISCVNGIFLYQALETHAGTVTENAYEKGLAYNKTLETSKNQPALKEKAAMDGAIFRWSINDPQDHPLIDGAAKVTFFRPVKEGNDFQVELKEVSSGIYEAKPQFPIKGLWTAQMDVQWKDQQYHTSQSIIVK